MTYINSPVNNYLASQVLIYRQVIFYCNQIIYDY